MEGVLIAAVSRLAWQVELLGRAHGDVNAALPVLVEGLVVEDLADQQDCQASCHDEELSPLAELPPLEHKAGKQNDWRDEGAVAAVPTSGHLLSTAFSSTSFRRSLACSIARI